MSLVNQIKKNKCKKQEVLVTHLLINIIIKKISNIIKVRNKREEMDPLWEKITDLDQHNYTLQQEQPIVKSQFRVKKNAMAQKKTSIQIHLYASLILFICASTPKAKISLTQDVQYQLYQHNNQLIIHKNERSIQLRLNDSDNMTKWAEALTKIGIHERNTEGDLNGQLDPDVINPSYQTNIDSSSEQNSAQSYPSIRDSVSQESNSIQDYSSPAPSIIIDQQITIQVSTDSTSQSTKTQSQTNRSQEGIKTQKSKNTNRRSQRINSKRKASVSQENLYSAPETLKPSMEHFIINANYLYRKAYRNQFYLKIGLEKIPEEQEFYD